MIDGRGPKVTWSKFSNNNKDNTACDFLLKSAWECVIPLQVRGDMSSKNRSLSNYMKSLRSTSHNGCAGSGPDHDTIIERFWREHSTMVKDHLVEKIRNLDYFGMLKTTERFDIWTLR